MDKTELEMQLWINLSMAVSHIERLVDYARRIAVGQVKPGDERITFEARLFTQQAKLIMEEHENGQTHNAL